MESMTMTNTPAEAPASETEVEETDRSIARAAVNGLAVVGFIALLVLGVGLAVYSARNFSGLTSKFGSAAVYLSSVFSGTKGPTGTPSSAVSFGQSGLIGSTTEATSTVATSTVTTVEPPIAKPAHPGTPASYPTPGPATSTTTPLVPALHGLPDLAVTSITTGYLTSNSTDTFVASSSVPHGDKPAVKFFVTNIGTNVIGPWTFNASLPNQPLYTAPAQTALLPGQSVQYVLGFDDTIPGTGTITITLNPNNAVSESNTNNDTATANILVQS